MRLLQWLGQKLDDGSHGMTWMLFIVVMIAGSILVFVVQNAITDIKMALGR